MGVVSHGAVQHDAFAEWICMTLVPSHRGSQGRDTAYEHGDRDFVV